MTMVLTSDRPSGAPLPVRVQTYIEALVQTCAQDRVPLVSVVLFGSAAKGGFSGDVARVLDLRPLETPFVDRIVFASIVASAVTVWGENLMPQVPVPSVRRLDVFKALFGFSGQVFLSAVTFPVLPDATKYAMGALKHSLHSCYFCYHGRTVTLEEEVDFFRRRLGTNQTLVDLLTLRGQYRRSFGFVIRCLPALVRLHLRTARDTRFPLKTVRGH